MEEEPQDTTGANRMRHSLIARALLCAGLTWLSLGGSAAGAAPSPEAVERGKKALLGRSFIPPAYALKAYDNAWRQWGLKEKPADYDRHFRARYGLHEAPYPNKGLPMGLREAQGLLGKGIATDCLVCHGGSIAGKSYVGLGNASLDYQAFVEEMTAASGRSVKSPFHLSRVRGTNEAGAMAVFLFELRNPDLSLRSARLDLGLHDDLCEDVPPWWVLKKKTTMYHTGGGDARSVRSLMQFLLTPFNPRSTFERDEEAFRDIQAYLLSLQPPRYVFPIDRSLAARGEQVFKATCARCHGTYGEKPTYPNRVVPLDEIGTDPKRYHGIGPKYVDHYNASWFAQEKTDRPGKGYPAQMTGGYQAPPLDGVWATAPYFHNGSVPTVYHVLNSKARPKLFTRSYRTGKDDYDPVKLGWKITPLERAPGPDVPAIARRKVYDTSQPGRGNGGHRFGDKLTEDQRMAVIEYLKTL
jgi:mono/diheme cytochrome c family protein